MKRFTIAIIAGIMLLATASAAQAHSRHHGGFRGSVSIAVPVGHHGYAVLGSGPYFYGYGPAFYRPVPYARYDYALGYKYGYRHGHRHKHRHDKRHHYDYRDDHHRRGRH